MAHTKSSPPEPPKMRILLIDDHALLRRGLASLIETEPDLLVCAEASSLQTGLAAIIASTPDLVITDLSFQDGDGLALIGDIKRFYPDLPVLALSMHDEAVYAERALRAGARGYVTKQEIDDAILIAIRRVLAGDIHLSEAMNRLFSQKFLTGGKSGSEVSLEQLTNRELEVFKRIGHGDSTRQIALALGLSVKTIESHREHLKAKLKLPSGTALNRCALIWSETGRLC